MHTPCALPDFYPLAETEKRLTQEVSEDSDCHSDGREAGVIIAAELTEDGSRLVDGAGDEGGILAVGGVVVAAVEDTDRLAVFSGKGFEELDEALLIVDLGGGGVSMGSWLVELDQPVR